MIFICLGNPERKYSKTRHNIGKMFGEYLVGDKKGRSLKEGEVFELDGNKVVFLNCYMNESGKYLKKILKKLNCFDFNQVYVVHDDLDIPFGEFRIQFARGTAGHHGVDSIVESLATKDFWRIRIGIGKPPVNIEPEDFVLMPFGEERGELEEIFVKVLQELKEC